MTDSRFKKIATLLGNVRNKAENKRLQELAAYIIELEQQFPVAVISRKMMLFAFDRKAEFELDSGIKLMES